MAYLVLITRFGPWDTVNLIFLPMVTTVYSLSFFYRFDYFRFFSVSFTLFRIICSRSVHVVANVRIASFTWMDNIPLCIYLVIHSPIDRHSGCCLMFGIVCKVAINMGVHISHWISVFISFECTPRSGDWWLCVDLFFLIFWGMSISSLTSFKLMAFSNSQVSS